MSWNKLPSAFVDQVRKDHSKRVRGATIRVLRGVVVKSPVDTGRFRANWQVSEGSAITTVVSGVLSPKTKIVKGERIPGKFVAGFKNQKIPTAGNLLFVTNNLPYSEALENGHSGQALHGVVALTILEVNAWLNK